MSRPGQAPRRWALPGAAILLLLLLAAATPASAQPAHVHAVVLDRVQPLATADFHFLPCEDSAAFVPLESGFRFEERQPGAGTVEPPYPSGYLALGCGEATTQQPVPAGARSVVVRFEADRRVDEFDLNAPGSDFEQALEFRAGNGTGDRRVAYLPPEAGAEPLRAFAPDSFLLPRGATGFELAWIFRDSSYFVAPTFPDVLSGEDFAATVQNVTLEFPGIPAQHRVGESLQRQGTLLVGETRVRVQVEDAGAADLRLEVSDRLAFEHLRGPDGRTVTAQASRTDAGPEGFDRHAILVETLDGGRIQLTVPREVLAEHGPGEYTVAFTSLDPVRTYPWALPFAVLVLLSPLPFALLALQRVRRFEDEAFGGFRRSARNLRIALAVAATYYVAVVASHFAGSRLDLMAAWPMPLEAVLLYVQVVVAAGAFLALFAVANELYHITVPKPLPAPASPPPAPLEDDA